MSLDPAVRDLLAAVRDLLAAVQEALSDPRDSWALAAARSALGGFLDGDDPGLCADMLRDFLATRKAAAKPLYPDLGDDLKRAGEQTARHKAGQP